MDMHVFDVFSIIGTIAFAMSGAFVAMEEEYDILGLWCLDWSRLSAGYYKKRPDRRAGYHPVGSGRFNHAGDDFGFRGVCAAARPDSALEENGGLVRCDRVIRLRDSRGIICYANESPIERCHRGGRADRQRRGMVRDLLAGRKPLVLRDEIYAVWAMAAGVAIGLGRHQDLAAVDLICYSHRFQDAVRSI